MEFTSHGAGRREGHPLKFNRALFAGIGMTAISVVVSHAIMALTKGVLMLREEKYEVVLMFTTIAFSFVLMKQAYLLIGRSNVPSMLLKLWSTATVLLALAARTTMLASLEM